MSARPSEAGDAFSKLVEEGGADDSVSPEMSQNEQEEIGEEDDSEQTDGDDIVVAVLLQNSDIPAAAKLKDGLPDGLMIADPAAGAAFADLVDGEAVRASVAVSADVIRSPASGSLMPVAAGDDVITMSALLSQDLSTEKGAEKEGELLDLARLDETRSRVSKASDQATMTELRSAVAFSAETGAPREVKLAPLLSKDRDTLEAEVGLRLVAHTRAEVATPDAALVQASPRQVSHIAHDVLRQIGSGVANRESDHIEITLKPEELGTVRLVITGGERPSVAVYAEHADTLDLLRRHADILARELRDSGLGGAEMSFADNSGAGKRQASDPGNADVIAEKEQIPAVAERQPMVRAAPQPRIGSQIDIRI